MPTPPAGTQETFVKIGPYRFDLVGSQAHTVTEQEYTQGGPVEFTTDDWSVGMLTAEQGKGTAQGQYLSSKGADGAFPKQIILQPTAVTIAVASGQTAFAGAPIKQVDWTPSGGSLSTYLINGTQYVYKLNGSAQWTVTRDLGNGLVASDIHVHGGILGVAYTSSHQYTSDDSSWTTANSVTVDRFATLNNNLWRAVRPNTLYAGTAFGGTYSAAYSVSDSTYNINSLMGVEQLLMVGKEDGVFTVDAQGTIIPMAPELRPQANANFASIRGVCTFNNDYYFRTLNGIIEIAAGDGLKYRVGLDQLASPDLPTVVVQALCSDDRYLYALCNNTSNNLMILRRTIRGSWHVFYWDGTTGTKQGRHMNISGALGYPALFFSYYDGSSAYTTKYIRLATYPNPVDDTNYRYSTLSQNHLIRLGQYGSPAAPVIFDRCTIQSRNLTANITVTPYYAVDGGSITQFGTAAATTNPLSTVQPATPPSGNLFDFYAYLSSNDATTTPIITGLSFQGWRRPQRRNVHQFLITAIPNQQTARGGMSRVSPAQTIDNLNALRDTNVYVTCFDELQRSFGGVLTNIQRVSDQTVGGSTEQPGHSYRLTVVESPGAVGSMAYRYDAAVYT